MQPAAYNLLRLLQTGETFNPEQLAQKMAMPLAGVYDLIEQLDAHSVRICDHGGALGVESDVDLLDAAALNHALPLPVEVLDECVSTNSFLLESADNTARLVVCELQTGGRGRRGNHWHSGLCDSLSFSLLWSFGISVGQLKGLPLAVGVGCVRALRKMGIGELALKWPNDLVHAKGKFGGVLIEMKPGGMQAVIGVGLNVRHSRRHEALVDYAITDLSELAPHAPSRTDLLVCLSLEIVDVLKEFQLHGFAPFREEWSHNHAFAGQRVRLSNGSLQVEGVARGVAEDGALLLLTDFGEQRFLSGELRRAA